MSPALNIFLVMSLSSSFTTPARAAIIIGVYPAYNYFKCYHSTYHYNRTDKNDIFELLGNVLEIYYFFNRVRDHEEQGVVAS